MRCGKESKTKGGRKLNIQSGLWGGQSDRRVNKVADGKGHIREKMCRVLHTRCIADKQLIAKPSKTTLSRFYRDDSFKDTHPPKVWDGEQGLRHPISSTLERSQKIKYTNKNLSVKFYIKAIVQKS